MSPEAHRAPPREAAAHLRGRWRRRGWQGLIAALLAGAMPMGWTQATPRGAQPTRALAAAEGEVIVRFKADAAIVRTHALAKAGRAEGAASAEEAAGALKARADALGARIGRALEAGAPVGERIQVMRQRGANAAELARRIAADPNVEWAEPNGRMRRLQAAPPNDPLYLAGPPITGVVPDQVGGPAVGQWYLRSPDATVRSSIDLPVAWVRGLGSSSVVVAVLDTGVRFDHPDLGRVSGGGRLLDGYDFISDAAISNDGNGRDGDAADPGDWVSDVEAGVGTFAGCDASPSSWHGTATASLVAAAANNGIGMVGVAPEVRLLPMRVLGKCYGDNADIQAAMRWAAGIAVAGVPTNPNPAKVISMSLGDKEACSAGFQSAVNDVIAAGAVVVASAGNSAGGPVGSPANCRGVIAVAALRHAGTKVGFSDIGAQVSVAAPGGNCVLTGRDDPCLYPILAALNSGGTVPAGHTWSDSFDYTLGTSFSAPLVSGIAALMLSQNPTLTPAQVKAALEATARPFPSGAAVAGVAACSPGQPGECACPNRGSTDFPLCGTGMADAGAAVNGIVAGTPIIEASPVVPAPGQTVALSAANSVAPPGQSVTGYAWSLEGASGVANGIVVGTNPSSATVVPVGEGAMTVRLTISYSGGQQATATQVVRVHKPSTSSGDSGGGALSLGWLGLLGLATLALAMTRPARPH